MSKQTPEPIDARHLVTVTGGTPGVTRAPWSETWRVAKNIWNGHGGFWGGYGKAPDSPNGGAAP